MVDDTKGERLSLVPVPDPTALTTEALKLAVENLRSAVDKDTAHLRRDLDRLEETQREEIASAVGHALDLCSEKFSSFEFRFAGVQQQFEERDERVSESARSNRELVEQALASQKEAVAKNEGYTTEQLSGIKSELQTEIRSLRQQVEDLKERLQNATLSTAQALAAGSERVGAGEGERAGRDRVTSSMIAAAGVVIAIIAVAAGLILGNS